MKKIHQPLHPKSTGAASSALPTLFLLRFLPLLLAVLLVVMGGKAEAQTRQDFREITNPNGNVVFRLDLYGSGSDYMTFSDGSSFTSARDFTNDEIDALARGLGYWAEVLSPNAAPATTVVVRVGIDPATNNNAGAYFIGAGGVTLTQDILANGNATALLGSGTTGDDAPGFHALLDFNNVIVGGQTGWTFDPNTQLIEGGPVYNYNMESIMIHEMGHTLGITSSVTDFAVRLDGNPGERMFIGVMASSVFGDYGTPQPVPMYHKSSQETSHFGLQNGLMTHHDFRNYASFMEVELAALQDIGYTIDRRNFFGRSYYTNGNGTLENPVEYTDGYFMSRGLTGTGTTAVWNGYDERRANNASHGLGLHIYGDDNVIKVTKKDLLSVGEAGGGIRVDGFRNTVIVDQGITVAADGTRGTGLLVAFGTNHHIINQGTIRANGTNGIGVRFDFGAPRIYNVAESYGSVKDLNDATVPLNGALVDSFDVSGTVSGSAAAIYIADNAHVKEINFLKGAAVSGDIVSNYVAVDGSNDPRYTQLTFGKSTKADGSAGTGSDDDFTFTYDDNIGGAGIFNITTMGGYTSLGGNNNFEVGIVDNASELNIRGKSHFQSLNVATAATLSGSGTTAVDTVLTNEGTISPGNGSIGTFTIEGKLVNTGGTFVIDINAGAAGTPVAGVHNDLIDVKNNTEAGVDGTAVIDGGTLVLNLVSNNKKKTSKPVQYTDGAKYVFLQAEDGLDVKKELDVQMASILLFDVSTGRDANSYWAEVARQYVYGKFGDTHNQVQVGNAVDRMGLSPDPGRDIFDVLVALDQLNENAGIAHRDGISKEVKFAEDQMSGAIYGSLANASIQNTTIVNNTLSSLLRRKAFGDPMCGYEGCDGMCEGECAGTHCQSYRNLWALGYGMGGKTQHDGNAYGYSQRFGGTMFGIDTYNEYTRFGAYFSYGEGRISSDLYDRVESDEFMGGLYFRREMYCGYFMVNAGLGYNSYDTYRNISFLDRKTNNRHGGIVGTVYAERGLEYEIGYLRWQPYIGMQFVANHQKAFDESGAGDLNLHSEKFSGESFRSALGSHFTVELGDLANGWMSFHLNAVWMHEFCDSHTDYTAQFSDLNMSRFTVRGNDIGKDWAILQFGLNHEFGNMSLYAGYDIYMNSHQVLHTGNVGISLNW